MITGSEIIRFALDDFGVEASIGASTLMVIAHLDGEMLLQGEVMERTGPFALADAAEVLAMDIQAGNNGDTMRLAGVEYTVLAIDQDAAGYAILSLEKEP